MPTSDFLSARADGVQWRFGDTVCRSNGYNLVRLLQQALARLLPAEGLPAFDGYTVRPASVRADGAWGMMTSRALDAVARAQGVAEGYRAAMRAEATQQRIGPASVAVGLTVLRRNGLAGAPWSATPGGIAFPADMGFPRWGHTLPRPAGWTGVTLPHCRPVTPADGPMGMVPEASAPEPAPAPPRTEEAPPDPVALPAPEDLTVAPPPSETPLPVPVQPLPRPTGIQLPPPPPPASPVGTGTILLVLGGLGLAGVGAAWALRQSRKRTETALQNPAMPRTRMVSGMRDREALEQAQQAAHAMVEEMRAVVDRLVRSPLYPHVVLDWSVNWEHFLPDMEQLERDLPEVQRSSGVEGLMRVLTIMQNVRDRMREDWMVQHADAERFAAKNPHTARV